jgi:general secretion pathway protein I
MRRQDGFTLIEVIVAAAILGMAAAALFGLLSKSLFNLKKIDDVRQYQLASERIMNYALLLPQLPPAGRAEGRFDRIGARWILKVTPWMPQVLDNQPADAVMKLDVQVVWPGRSGDRSISLETIKPVSLSYSNYDFQRAVEAILAN